MLSVKRRESGETILKPLASYEQTHKAGLTYRRLPNVEDKRNHNKAITWVFHICNVCHHSSSRSWTSWVRNYIW